MKIADSLLRASVEERDDIERTINDYLGHFSLIKTNKIIKEIFGWHKGRKDIYKFVESFDSCEKLTAVKKNIIKPTAFLSPNYLRHFL